MLRGTDSYTIPRALQWNIYAVMGFLTITGRFNSLFTSFLCPLWSLFKVKINVIYIRYQVNIFIGFFFIYTIFKEFFALFGTDIFWNSPYVLCCGQISLLKPLLAARHQGLVKSQLLAEIIEGQKSIMEFLPFPFVFWWGSGVLLYLLDNNASI